MGAFSGRTERMRLRNTHLEMMILLSSRGLTQKMLFCVIVVIL